MNRTSFPFALLAIILALATAANLAAGPVPAHSLAPAVAPGPEDTISTGLAKPVQAGFFTGAESNRRRVVQIAALGMALALVIMYRSKH